MSWWKRMFWMHNGETVSGEKMDGSFTNLMESKCNWLRG